MSKRQSKPKPDKALYKDFLAALVRAIDHGETVAVHGYTISWPKTQPNYYALCIEAPRTVRDVWDGSLHTIVGLQGGDASRPKHMAASLAFGLEHDRTLRARLLTEAKPGLLSNTVTHQAA